MDGPDQGATGPAALARPLAVTKVAVKISPTRMAWREVRRYMDVITIDQVAAALEERELMAALRLYGLFCASGQLLPDRYELIRSRLRATL